jgi:hypothetical protein
VHRPDHCRAATGSTLTIQYTRVLATLTACWMHQTCVHAGNAQRKFVNCDTRNILPQLLYTRCCDALSRSTQC